MRRWCPARCYSERYPPPNSCTPLIAFQRILERVVIACWPQHSGGLSPRARLRIAAPALTEADQAIDRLDVDAIAVGKVKRLKPAN
jgi:hypothetical protein